MIFDNDIVISKTDSLHFNELDHLVFNDELNSDFLYHYTTIQSLVPITQNKCLRASPFTKVNDPAESEAINRHSLGGKWKDDGDPDLNKKLFQASNTGKAIADEVRRNAHVLCFSHDGFENCGLIRKGYAIPQMWSHYANLQQGVCIVISKDKLMNKINGLGLNFHSRSVVYDTAQASGSNIVIHPEKVMNMGRLSYKDACIEASPDLFWFYKDDGWRYEQESRVVFPEPEGDYTYISIENCVAGICLGSRFPNQAMVHINRFKEALGVEGQSPKINWDKGIASPSGIDYKSHKKAQL